MKTYVVAVLSFFENENKVFKVEVEDEVKAMKEALIKFFDMKEGELESQEWVRSLSDTIEGIKDECFNSDMSISDPMEII